MLIRCPTCSSSYDLPDHLFQRTGRTLRCAHCRECWTVRGDDAGRNNVFDLFGPDHSPEIVAEARLVQRALRPGPLRRPHPRARIAGSLRRASRGAAPVALSLLLLAVAMAGVARKEDVVRAMPRSAALFQSLGLPVNLRGLALDEVHGTLAASNQGASPVLTLEGKISNLRREATSVPRLRITLRDKTQTALYTWTAPAPKSTLDGGETMVFRSRLATPPQAGHEIVVSFADPADTPRGGAEHR